MGEDLLIERRGGSERRSQPDRRAGRDRRRDCEREIARQLPDEFAQAGGDPAHRIAGLVNRHWPHEELPARSELTQQLLPILQDLLAPGTPVTDEHRERCESAVLDWVDQQ